MKGASCLELFTGRVLDEKSLEGTDLPENCFSDQTWCPAVPKLWDQLPQALSHRHLHVLPPPDRLPNGTVSIRCVYTLLCPLGLAM